MANAIDLKKLRDDLKGPTRADIDAPITEEKTPASQTQELAPYPSLISWEAYEFHLDMASSVNLALAGLVLIAAGIITAFLKNFLFALFLAVAGGLTLHHAFRHPRLITYGVTSRGVRADRRIYEFEALKSFWIAYDPPHQMDLVLDSRRALMPHLYIPLGDVDPLRLREILLGFIREERHEIPLAHAIAKRIGF